MLSGEAQKRKTQKALDSLHLPGLNTAACQKAKEASFQGYHQTGAAREEITRSRAEDAMLLVTPLHYTSVKSEQSAYQIVLRFHLFSKDFFSLSSLTQNSFIHTT